MENCVELGGFKEEELTLGRQDRRRQPHEGAPYREVGHQCVDLHLHGRVLADLVFFALSTHAYSIPTPTALYHHATTRSLPQTSRSVNPETDLPEPQRFSNNSPVNPPSPPKPDTPSDLSVSGGTRRLPFTSPSEDPRLRRFWSERSRSRSTS